MLVLTRRIGERIMIGEDIIIEVVEVMGQRTRLGITAPPEMIVVREELLKTDEAICSANELLPK